MQIIHYSKEKNKEYWINEISKSKWRAASFLAGLLREDKLKESFGENAELLLLTDGGKLVSFCTYAEHDEVSDRSLMPWAGFVFTFPEFRGQRRIGKLLEYVYALAKKDGYKSLYISTGEVGLYEKYGFTYWKDMPTIYGDSSRVYRMKIEEMDYSGFLGKEVRGTIDRPLGSSHPQFPDLIYPVNYGYVDGLFAGDGEEQDAYVFGTDAPISAFTGKIVGVIHRLNDCEDKWIVSLSGDPVDPEAIRRLTDFQEKYYMGELYT